MNTDNVIPTIRPDPDSHFRLRPCPACHSVRGVYVGCRIDGSLLWRVRCQDCGYATDKTYSARHDAQVAWNKKTIKHALRRLPAMVGSADGVG